MIQCPFPRGRLLFVRQTIDRFSAWKFEAGEELLERALEERRKHEHEPPRSPYFNTCVLTIALVGASQPGGRWAFNR